MAIDKRERADIHAETPRQGGAHLFLIEQFTFDFARLQDLGGKALK